MRSTSRASRPRTRRIPCRDAAPASARRRLAARGRHERSRSSSAGDAGVIPRASAHASRLDSQRDNDCRPGTAPPNGADRLRALPQSGRECSCSPDGLWRHSRGKTFLGIPCFTLRANTERPVTVTAGTNTLLGLEPARIVEIPGLISEARKRPSQVPSGWDGEAAQRVVDVLAQAPLPRLQAVVT